MTGNEIRQKFLEFFKEKGHTVVPSSSLLPDDPSVLLTTAGMQQFKKYYTGELDAMRDFGSKNTTSVQKSFRTSDIDEVGDERHLTFFEMLGNFSFGGYFKEEAIKYAHEFVTKVMGLTIDYVTVYEGDMEVSADDESENIWKSIDAGLRIERCGRGDNFWGPTGPEGPCGPTTEVYVKNGAGEAIEIWNVVFNQYFMHADKRLEPLKVKGIDTGMGLERLAMVSQKTKTIFETDLFEPLVSILPGGLTERIKRIVADHARGISFLIADGVRPSNKEAGYMLRRLMRRAIVHEFLSDENPELLTPLFKGVVANYKDAYPELNEEVLFSVFAEEKAKFKKTIQAGIRELNRTETISAEQAFGLYESYGLPYEVIKELGGKQTDSLQREAFDEEFKKHQEISRAGMEKKFGGHGLIMDTGELKAGDEEALKKATRLHTATHLLQKALREVLGTEVHQMGSDITPERARFDFSFSRKMTPEEIKEVEGLVNEKVKEDLSVQFVELPKEEAEKSGALFFFKEKYPAKVKVYYTGKDLATAWSKEFCGGPHVTHTGEVGHIKIAKEEAVGAGVRRIRATVE